MVIVSVRAWRQGDGIEVLFERIRDEGEDFLVLVEEEHDSEVPESFVGESGLCAGVRSCSAGEGSA